MSNKTKAILHCYLVRKTEKLKNYTGTDKAKPVDSIIHNMWTAPYVITKIAKSLRVFISHWWCIGWGYFRQKNKLTAGQSSSGFKSSKNLDRKNNQRLIKTRSTLEPWCVMPHAKLSKIDKKKWTKINKKNWNYLSKIVIKTRSTLESWCVMPCA